MKTWIKSVVAHAVEINWLWKVISKTIVPFSDYAKAIRCQKVNLETIPDLLSGMFSELTVLHGVFAGMKYPRRASVGSSLYPKLLGSYEKEIEALLESICDNQYTEIVDIGCAEGYYAVGLAMRIKSAKVFAFDTSCEARQLCKEMAELNGVAERVVIESFCDAGTLARLPLTERALVVSDCEGYEKELFTKESVAALSRHDVLIEVHDFMDLEISAYLRELFCATHVVQVLASIDDIKKAQEYRYEELEGLSLAEKKQILQEGRPAIMEWFYLKPRERT